MKRKLIKNVIVTCMFALILLTFVTTNAYAKAPNINTKFKKLKLGSTQLKDSHYDRDNSVMAGVFTAPTSGVYKITVVNNGDAEFYCYLLNKNLAEIEYDRIDRGEQYTFKSVKLKKNQKIYYYSDGYIGDELLATKVIIKQTSGGACLNKTSASIKKGKSVKLKLKKSKKKIKWVSATPSVATVTSKGLVKAKKKGTTYIYAVVGSKSYKCKIRVK